MELGCECTYFCDNLSRSDVVAIIELNVNQLPLILEIIHKSRFPPTLSYPHILSLARTSEDACISGRKSTW